MYLEAVMNTSHKSSNPFNPDFSMDAAWKAMEDLRTKVEYKVGTRMGKGDVRSAILVVLAEEPMHGYQIIRKIEEHTDGVWKPSAGSVYPTLQLLADEGLVTAETANERKVYALTNAGREAAADAQAPWDTGHGREHGAGEHRNFSGVSKAGFDLAQAVTNVVRTGTTEQQTAAIEVLDNARRKIYSILAQD
jgi:DNA-binding PadR family transcriptional regulator